MVDVSNSNTCKALAKAQLVKFDSKEIGDQAKIGRELIVDNAKLLLAGQTMAAVMVQLDEENEKLETQVKIFEKKTGTKITDNEMNEFRLSGGFRITPAVERNKKLVARCKKELK